MLEGKVLVTVGDSITYGADMDPAGIAPDGTLMTYGWQIAERNHMKFYNCGISGSTIQHIEGKANCFSTEVAYCSAVVEEAMATNCSVISSMCSILCKSVSIIRASPV